MLKQPALSGALGNDGLGGVSDYASSLICLFWFESSYSLHHLTTCTRSVAFDVVRDHQLESYNSLPTAAFSQWVRTLLNTTRLSTNVVVLALLFVYRLKLMNPLVQAKRGSEYRLLTVAFMLSNKFLDDNTYTNKTWAQVTGIEVKEIHVMEVEFLSNMRYTMFTSKRQWLEWQELARNFASLAVSAQRNMHTRAMQPHSYSLPSPPWSVPDSPSLHQEGTDTYSSRKRGVEEFMNGGMSKRKRLSRDLGVQLLPLQPVQSPYHQTKPPIYTAKDYKSVGVMSPVPYASVAPKAFNIISSQIAQPKGILQFAFNGVPRDSPYAPVKAVSALREPVSPFSHFERLLHEPGDPRNLQYETIGHSRNIRQGVAGGTKNYSASVLPFLAPSPSSILPPPTYPYPLQNNTLDLNRQSSYDYAN